LRLSEFINNLLPVKVVKNKHTIKNFERVFSFTRSCLFIPWNSWPV